MKITWQHVAIVGIVVAGVVALGLTGRDTAALIGLAGAVLAGLGIVAGQQGEIKTATNGNLARLVALVEATMLQLRQMPPPPTPSAPVPERERASGAAPE